MESQKPKIAMYAKRPFGEKLNASFDFIKENWNVLLKFATYFLLPLSLLQALSLNSSMPNMMNLSSLENSEDLFTNSLSSMSFLFYYGLFTLIGSVMMTSLIYALMRTYNEREERLQGITLSELKPLLLRNAKKILAITLLCVGVFILVIFIVGALTAISLYTLFLTIPLVIAFIVPLALLSPIYLFEDVTIMEAFRKTFRLGFATWGGVFLISLVMGIIANVLQGVTTMPWYIATLVKYFFAMSDAGGATVSFGYSFILYLLAIIQTFGSYLSIVFSFVGLAYQYGHASEVVDGITVESDIDNFDKL